MLSLLRSFRKSRAGPVPAASVQVSLAVGSAAERRPQPGLIRLDLTVASDAELEDARLMIRREGEAVFTKALRLSPTPSHFWLALHGQLLADGPVTLTLEMADARGAVLAQRPITLQVVNRGPVAAQVADSLRRSGAPLVLDGVCDSAVYPYDDAEATPWFDRPVADGLAEIARREAAGEVSAEEADALRSFVRDGFLMMEGVVDADHLARLNAAVDAAVAAGHEGYEWGSSQRMHGLHEIYPAIRELWAHPKVLRMLSLIYGVPALPYQSLTYVFGSQQEYHQDTIHLTPFPAGCMNGVWTALEDVQPDSGELVVYSGTHRLPRVYAGTVGAAKVTDGDFNDLSARLQPAWTRLLDGLQPPRVVYRPKAGSVLIWHENLMHGGSPRVDLSKSRRSVVCHYFAEGAVVYHDSLGVPGTLPLPEVPEQA